ncbi:MAG: efflux RND transporter periplasmic adaptor subunit [Muribaculaceae bacterium]|nr:efflux RND transporter periplasmic adaptor subunit [Muribaculaceae bacterium]
MTTVIRCLSVAAVVVMTGCADSHSDNKEKEENYGHEEHGNEIVIEHEQIEKLGIKTTIVNPSEFQNVIKCGGEILPSPLSQAVVAAKSDGIIKLSAGINEGVEIKNGGVVCSISSAGISGGDPRADARTQLTAAKQNLERVQKLYNSNLATAKELQEAQVAVEMAKNAVSGNSSSSVAVSPISGVVSQLLVASGSYVTTGTPIAVVTSSARLTLKASVPQRYFNEFALIKTANFKLPYSDKIFALDEMQGHRLTAGTMASATNGYFDIEFSFVGDGSVAPGSYADVYLLGNPESGVISVPTKSVIEEQGKYAVFVRESKEHFEKRPVAIGRTDGKRIEITSGLAKGEEVVTEGAAYVKLAGNSGVVPEGHHHH